MKHGIGKCLLVAIALSWLLVPALRSQDFQLLYLTGTGAANGGYPTGGLVKAIDGTIYGAMRDYGPFNSNGFEGGGTIFQVNGEGAFRLVYTFYFADTNNGNEPVGQICQGADGCLYGTTEDGGDYGWGTIYRLDTNGVLTTLSSFDGTNGYNPDGLIEGSDGNLYGATEEGGTEYNDGNPDDSYAAGTIFKITPDGSKTIMAEFTGTNGINPLCLLQATDGNFYGVTEYGGNVSSTNLGGGVVFKMTQDGVLTSIKNFANTGDTTDGWLPRSLVQSDNGALYGSTLYGGQYGLGTIFEIATNGQFSLLDGTNGSWAGSLIQASDGNIYGDGGNDQSYTIFQMTLSGQIKTIFDFDYNTTGDTPNGLVDGGDGWLYGTVEYGPGNGNVGAIFRLRLPAPELQIASQGEQLVLSWPTNFPGYTLQSAPGLDSSSIWVGCTNMPIISGVNYTVAEQLSTTTRFYRLKR